MESTAGVKRLTEVKTQRGIFLEVTLSPEIEMMALNHLGNAEVDTNLLNHKKKSVMDDIKLFANGKEMETLLQAREYKSRI